MGKKPLFTIDFDAKGFGEMLRAARKSADFSTREAARIAEQSKSQLLRIEAGEGTTPEKLVKVCLACGVPPGLMLSEACRVNLHSQAIAESIAACGALRTKIHSDADAERLLKMASESLVIVLRLLFAEDRDEVAWKNNHPEHFQKPLKILAWELGKLPRRVSADFYRELREDGIEVLLDYGFFGDGSFPDPKGQKIHPNELADNTLTVDSFGMKTRLLDTLLDRVRVACAPYGHKAELARFLKLSPQAVSNYLGGISMPSAEVALRMDHWANTYALQKKDPIATANSDGALAEPKKPTDNEKQRRGRKSS